MNKQRSSIVYFLMGIIFLFAIYAAWRHNGSPSNAVDDAEIYMSYAENLAAGNGFVYANNSERVEGFTSILWLLVCALQFLISAGETGIMVMSVSVFLCSQALAMHILSRHCKSRGVPAIRYQIAYFALIILYPAYVTWMSITLMDIGLWGLLVLVLTYMLLFPPHTKRAVVLSAIVFAVAPAVRPEAMLFAPVILIFLCATLFRNMAI